MKYLPSVAEIEEMLAAHLQAKRNDPTLDNLPTVTVLSRSQIQSQIEAVEYSDFLRHAQYHYAVARLLFQARLHWYAFYCSQQAVETYLKAFIKHRGGLPPMTHELSKLLERARELDTTSQFINGPHIESVVLKFDPYNELPRYPAHRVGTENPAMVGFFPDDMQVLDYFVLRMHEQLPTPTSPDFLPAARPFLYMLEHQMPGLFALLVDSNINAPSR
jgi:HEPN domain-containing protein